MCKKNDFLKLIENILKEILKREDFKKSVNIICRFITEYYPNTQIFLAEKLGKRLSYIEGAGKETYTSYKVLEINNNYFLVMQNFKDICSKEQEFIVLLFKILLVFKTK